MTTRRTIRARLLALAALAALLALAAVVAYLAGESRAPLPPLHLVRPGITKAEVRAVFGECRMAIPRNLSTSPSWAWQLNKANRVV